MRISKKIQEKILSDNEFSLDLAKSVKRSQPAIKAQATRLSRELLGWEHLEFYVKKGFGIDEIFDRPITAIFIKK